jgi:hypothetical protein
LVAAYEADGTPSATTKADIAALKKNGKSRTAHLQGIYQRGVNRENDPGVGGRPLDSDERAAYESGLEEADHHDQLAAGHPEPGRTPTPPAPDPTPKPSPGPGGGISAPGQVTTMAHQGAGALLGLVVYAVVINYLRSGTAGVKLWFDAKFLNKPGGGQTTPAAANNGTSVASPPTTAPSGSSSGGGPV